MDGVDLRDLRAFLVCAEELNFGRTAQRLSLTPGRVSQTIAKLERQLGGALFERTSRRVALTTYGITVRDELGPHYEALMSSLHGVARGRSGADGTLRIGLYGMAWGASLAPLVALLRQRHPRCTVQRVDLGLDEPLARLQRGEVDAMASYLPVTDLGLSVGPVIMRSRRCVLLARDHPLTTRETLRWDDLADYAFTEPVALPRAMREKILPPTTPSGRVLRRTLRVQSMTEMMAAVADGIVIHPTMQFLADYHNYPGIVTRPLVDVDADPLISAVIYRDEPPSEELAAFLEIATECGPRLSDLANSDATPLPQPHRVSGSPAQ